YDREEYGIQDEKKAFLWYARAVEAGDENSLVNLGNFYLSGKGGVKKDLEMAKQIFTRAADSKDEEISFWGKMKLTVIENSQE
ncbi:MAG: sel1 repeat family protein, partial [Oscillospiraceae bacterium]|nr:sel1 repeat family protein [Oscillospiraceae bacterium]